MIECYLVTDYEYAKNINESQKTEQESTYYLCEFLRIRNTNLRW